MAALVSGYGSLSANVVHVPRITYALARQGDFPAFLGVVHSKYRTPYISILVYAALVFIFALVGDFQWNALLSAASRLSVYGAMALAVPLLRKRNDGEATVLLAASDLFAGLGMLFLGGLGTRMGLSEFAVVGATLVICLVQWGVGRRLGL